jgi:hypothetical protein
VQWTRDGQPIDGATSSAYRVGPEDVGRDLGVRLSPPQHPLALARALSADRPPDQFVEFEGQRVPVHVLTEEERAAVEAQQARYDAERTGERVYGRSAVLLLMARAVTTVYRAAREAGDDGSRFDAHAAEKVVSGVLEEFDRSGA